MPEIDPMGPTHRFLWIRVAILTMAKLTVVEFKQAYVMASMNGYALSSQGGFIEDHCLPYPVRKRNLC